MSISIITVALNSASHIRQAIDSIASQDDGRLQYIVVDGASTDDTVAIVESYRPQFGERLVVISEKDQGLYDAMNKGIALATGDVIGILNSDDQYLPGTIAAVETRFEEQDADIVYGDVEVHGPDGPELYNGTLNGIREIMSIPHPGCFVRREAYARWGVFDTRYRFHADYDLLLRWYYGGARFVPLNRLVARFEGGGLSSGSFEKRRREHYAIHRRQIGLRHALWVQTKILTRLGLAKARQSLGRTFLGADRYESLRQRWRRANPE
jgi:glycosyltransferase involved in cell wall biosynthesis